MYLLGDYRNSINVNLSVHTTHNCTVGSILPNISNVYTVYYAHWELVVPDIPPEQMGEGDLFVGYFDYNLHGTGVTAVY